MRRRFLFWAMGLLTSAAWAQSPPPDLRGIYIYTNGLAAQMAADLPALSASFSIPGVDGVAVVLGWGDVEPAMGKYDWTVLDQWIGQVVALGKKIDLVVPAGSNTPLWLFQPPPAGPGATELIFTVSPHDGETGHCDSDMIAAPWDPAFLAQWDAMLANLSAHLKSAGTYSAITLVRLTGINRTSEELRLPAETAQSTGLACVSDAITIWQQAGYRPSLLLQGWNAVIGSFEKSFPDKSFAVSIIASDAFPPIDQNGAVITGTPPDPNQPLLMSASQMFPGRLVVQLDFLMPGQTASPAVTNAAQNFGTMAAFQTNEYFGDSGAACAGPETDPTPCTDATFLAMLETGIYPLGQTNPLRSQYIEVFHDNAAAFPDDILQAHFQLAPPAFFAGQVSLGSSVEYLQLPDTIVFGYYAFTAGALFYHYDMGYEAFIPGSASDIYLYDFTSGHWWYTSNTLFPYLYDFTLNNWLYYFPATNNPGRYTTNPRYFSDLTTGKIIMM